MGGADELVIVSQGNIIYTQIILKYFKNPTVLHNKKTKEVLRHNSMHIIYDMGNNK